MQNNKYLFISLLLIAFVLFFGDYQDRLSRADFLSKTIFLPFTYTLNELKTIKQLKIENAEQKNTIAKLVLKNVEYETKLNKYKSSNLNFEINSYPYIISDVIGFSGNFLGKTVIINKGLLDGINIDNPVFSSEGIIGKVIIAYQNFSIVLPINHPSFKTAVLNKNSGTQGILESDVYNKISMSYMRFGSNIAIGDTIVTSNLSQVFPSYLPIGKVISLEESSDALYLKGIIMPFSDLLNLQTVFVLLKENAEDINIDFQNLD
ncbi:MAG: rod shape-determining protein MreC [Candidatus Cloacimonetes bacterium]|nr:rod shape-determining protein MreC [Candidatus Cloacimonadota bacterium]MDD4156549.1 rod shape-determining protein MreC [Candidatus Cloacimonadota bacterium]